MPVHRCTWLVLQLASAVNLLPGRPPTYAIVRFYNDLDELSKIANGTNGEPKPCMDKMPLVDLILYYSGEHKESLDPKIDKVMQDVNKDKCFFTVRHEYANIPDGMQYTESACRQFVKMYQLDEPLWGYSAVFLMQPGMFPIKDGWLHDVMPQFNEIVNDDIWMVGGVYSPLCMFKVSDRPRRKRPWVLKKDRVAASMRKDGHIQANAIYSSSPDWSALVREHDGHCEDERDWDYWIFQRYKTYHEEPKLWKWRQDNKFVDCKSSDPNFVTLPFNRIPSMYPEAVFVHAEGELSPFRKDMSMDMFKQVTDPWGPENGPREYPIFWHVPRAAGNTIERMVKDVYNLTQLYWHSLRGKWYIRTRGQPDVELGTQLDINPGQVGMVATESLRQVRSILNTNFIGRIFTVFRHPVERLVSAYYFLKNAHWYNVAKRYNTLKSFVDSEDCEEDWMCYQLSDLVRLQPHLPTAKEILRKYVLVGLVEKMEETAQRFEKFFGWQHVGILSQHQATRTNIFNDSDPMFERLSSKLSFDMELYTYGHQVFEEQRALFN